uniref:Uncharacterized protein n=1 Tax=Wuchereria bancrofti TaxID=6293 RepID=A0A1I8EI40_WUCBA
YPGGTIRIAHSHKSTIVKNSHLHNLFNVRDYLIVLLRAEQRGLKSGKKEYLLGGKTTAQYCYLLYEVDCMRLLVRFALIILVFVLLIAAYEYLNIRQRVISRNDRTTVIGNENYNMDETTIGLQQEQTICASQFLSSTDRLLPPIGIITNLNKHSVSSINEI